MNEDGMAYENRGHNIEENSQNNVRLSPDISGAPGRKVTGPPGSGPEAPKERSSRS